MKKFELEKFSFEKYAKESKTGTKSETDDSKHVQEFIAALNQIGEILQNPEKLEERRKQYREVGE